MPSFRLMLAKPVMLVLGSAHPVADTGDGKQNSCECQASTPQDLTSIADLHTADAPRCNRITDASDQVATVATDCH